MPFHKACYNGVAEIALCLLKRTPKIDLKNNIYGTLLHFGVINGSLEVVVALLEAGAPLNETDLKGNTAVYAATKLGQHNIFRILLQQGADAAKIKGNAQNAKHIVL